MPPDAARFIAEARAWLGTPWRHQASARGQGCDCIGLVKGAAEAAGLAAVDEAEWRAEAAYPRAGTMRRLVRGCDRHLIRVVGPPRPGDILVFALQGEPQHLGILTEAGTIVHADSVRAAVVETAIPPEARIAGAWRLPALSVAR
ncbi:MAG TPA: NlpC/P60 family protein [Thermohalobaculum sp.]|nr:NlpC/P60 family protein [Thermohalobaculum sp.]